MHRRRRSRFVRGLVAAVLGSASLLGVVGSLTFLGVPAASAAAYKTMTFDSPSTVDGDVNGTAVTPGFSFVGDSVTILKAKSQPSSSFSSTTSLTTSEQEEAFPYNGGTVTYYMQFLAPAGTITGGTGSEGRVNSLAMNLNENVFNADGSSSGCEIFDLNVTFSGSAGSLSPASGDSSNLTVGNQPGQTCDPTVQTALDTIVQDTNGGSGALTLVLTNL